MDRIFTCVGCGYDVIKSGYPDDFKLPETDTPTKIDWMACPVCRLQEFRIKNKIESRR